jgi:DNA-binding transcriptional MerR regulator
MRTRNASHERSKVASVNIAVLVLDSPATGNLITYVEASRDDAHRGLFWLSRVSVKTLRYYDELGLIKPARVDEFTGYRYYDHGQYVRLNRVRALRDLGFSLESIAQALDAGLSAEQLRGMLRLRRSEIEQRIGEEQGRLARLDAWLSYIEMEDAMSEYEVVVKKVEPAKVACVRGQAEAPQQQGKLWAILIPYMEQHKAKPAGNWLALYHDEGMPEGEWDIEVCRRSPMTCRSADKCGCESSRARKRWPRWCTVGRG